MNCRSAFEKLLFSVTCQTTIAYRAIHSFHFHHLWVRHTVNYIIPPYMWVCHTVRNVGPPHSGGSATITLSPYLSELPESCQQWQLAFLSTVAFRANKNLEGTTCFPSTIGVGNIAFRSYQSCQQWELTFLSNIALRTTNSVNCGS